MDQLLTDPDLTRALAKDLRSDASLLPTSPLPDLPVSAPTSGFIHALTSAHAALERTSSALMDRLTSLSDDAAAFSRDVDTTDSALRATWDATVVSQ